MGGVVKAMESAMKSMNLEKVRINILLCVSVIKSISTVAFECGNETHYQTTLTFCKNILQLKNIISRLFKLRNSQWLS